MAVTTAVFDFDGVLIDSYNFIRKIVEDVGHSVNEEVFKAHHDGNVLEAPQIPFTQESYKKFYAEYLRDVRSQNPFFSAEELEKLHENFALFIVSSGREDYIADFLSCHKLDYFKEILGANFSSSKAEKFKYLFSTYNLQPEQCIFVTDTLGDVLEGNSVGVRTIAVDFGFHDRERLQKGNPYKIVSSTQEVLDSINTLA